MKKMMNKATIGIVAILGAATALGAHGVTQESLTLYQGTPIQNVTGITFDGTVFTMPDKPPIPRTAIQSVDFQNKAVEKAAVAPAMASLSPLAQEQLKKATGMARQFPGVSGIILVDDGEFIYHPDGTNVYRYHFAGLVLKEEAKNWAQLTLGFTEGRSRNRLLYAHSVGPDGEVRSLDPGAMKTGSPSEEMVFFNPTHKINSGVIPGVEKSSIVEYAYEYEEYNPENPRLFSPGFMFQGQEPVAFSRVMVSVPKDSPFHFVTKNFSTPQKEKPVIEEKDGMKQYTWQLENMPPLTAEPMMPPEQDLVPRMDSSVFADQAEAFGMIRTLQEARMTVTPEIQAKVDEITKGVESLDKKMARIYHWVQENTRYISIKGSFGAGVSGHTEQETLDNRYGDCTDKSILFSTMLKAVGVTAYPILLMTNDAGTAVTEIPTLSGNHCITEICAAGRDFYLDSTSQNYRYPFFRCDDHGTSAFNAIRGDIKPIPVPPPSDNARISKLDVTVLPNGDCEVKTVNRYNGSVEAGVRGFWKQVREDNYKLMMAEYVNSISPGAELQDFALTGLKDLAQPLEMRIDYTLRGHAIRAKKLMYLRIPTLEREFPEAALETRKYAIQYMTTEQRDLEVTLALPKGFKARWLPKTLDIQNPYLTYHAAYEDKGEHIVFKETFQRLQRIIPATDYAVYRDALRAIAAFSKQELFLTQKG